jgi:hypothetical protein
MKMLRRATDFEGKRDDSIAELGRCCGMSRRQEIVTRIFRNGLVLSVMMLYVG